MPVLTPEQRRKAISDGMRRAWDQKREATLQSQFIRRCNRCTNPPMLAMKIVSPGNNGITDTLVLVTDIEGNGHAVFVEMKRPGEEPSHLQEHKLNELRRRGFVAGWADDADLAFARIFTECKKRGIKL